MKLRAVGRREGNGSPALFSLPVAAVVCRDYLFGVWNVGTAPPSGTREIRGMVVHDVFAGGNRVGMADVPVFALKTASARRIAQSNFGCYLKYSGRGSSVVEQPIRKTVVPF